MRALRPGLNSSRQAQMTERGAIGLIDLPSLKTACELKTSTEWIEEWVCYCGGKGTSTLGFGKVAGDLDCARSIGPICRISPIGPRAVECIIAETKFLGISAGSGEAVI